MQLTSECRTDIGKTRCSEHACEAALCTVAEHNPVATPVTMHASILVRLLGIKPVQRLRLPSWVAPGCPDAKACRSPQGEVWHHLEPHSSVPVTGDPSAGGLLRGPSCCREMHSSALQYATAVRNRLSHCSALTVIRCAIIWFADTTLTCDQARQTSNLPDLDQEPACQRFDTLAVLYHRIAEL